MSCLFKALDSGASTEVTIAVKLPKGTGAPQSLIPPTWRANEADPEQYKQRYNWKYCCNSHLASRTYTDTVPSAHGNT